MAVPANSFTSYDSVGIREDLADTIDNIDPHETPFYSACSKTKVKNTFPEWQVDNLRSSADNFHPEGDDTTPEARTPTTRLRSYTQIFKNAVVVPDTDEGLDKAGRQKEIAYQVALMLKEQKLDIEKALFDNQAYDDGDPGNTGRRLAGLGAWLKTNTSFGGTGADPVTIGSTARTDGTQRAFTQTLFDGVMQSIWESGGKPDTVYLSAFQMNAALGFVGNNSQRSNVAAGDAKVYNDMAIYVTPWGSVNFVPCRENRSRDVFIMQSDKWALGVLRPTKQKELAKTGDNTKRQIVTELTLCAKNEAASGGIFDLTTS